MFEGSLLTWGFLSSSCVAYIQLSAEWAHENFLTQERVFISGT
jgi:hypothetical protein